MRRRVSEESYRGRSSNYTSKVAKTEELIWIWVHYHILHRLHISLLLQGIMRKEMPQKLSEVSRWQCHSCTSIRRGWIEYDHNTTNNRLLNRMDTTKTLSLNNGIVVWNRKRRMIEIWTQIVPMHRWISSTTVLDAEGIWIVTLTVHDQTQTQPIPISEWRGRGGSDVWVAFAWVEDDGRELAVIYLCLCCYRFSPYIYCIVLNLLCLFDCDFSGDCVIKLFGMCIATHPISTSKSLHRYHHNTCFLRWIMVICFSLTIFNGPFPVR